MEILFNVPKIEEAPKVIRVISVGSFRRRLSLTEKVAIQVSGDPVVQVLNADLLASSFVDLDFPELIEGLNYLVSVGILEAERLPEILKDGTQDELV
jgi:hypothetical protein